ncbi:MAG: hypothetical protein LBR61_10550 [Synergistaceae bacterium]|jgi:RNase H-fold protein (predicted Holliday junction resolvase)|nr:hypothetical protein [Synergistaceae bacterium]
MILGLDPGRDKTGWALVEKQGDLIWSGIVPTEELSVFFQVLDCRSSEWEKGFSRWRYERVRDLLPEGEETGQMCVMLGNGTGSRDILEKIAPFDVRVFEVDEKGTTLAARDLYWHLHGVVGWRKFLPRRLRVPPRILDDMAAWAIALRGLEKWSGEKIFILEDKNFNGENI